MKPLTPEALRRRAKRGTLEVEHILASARAPSPELAEALEVLAVEQEWPKAPSFPLVPFATWAEVVILYCRGGHQALEDAIKDSALRDFALPLLVEIGGEQSLEIVLRLAAQLDLSATDNLDVAHSVASAVNFLGMNGAEGNAQAQWRASEFLNRLLPLSQSPVRIGTVLCALRFFGDDQSLSLMKALPELPYEWKSVKNAAIRAVKKRAQLLA